ncbi:MAG: Fic family protein [Lentisphaerae bacterium]|nr:Fic family protein [Lentisphaerota bacterium]
MPGKPYQSKLAPHEAEIFELRDKGVTYRAIAEQLSLRHALNVTHNAVFSFLKTRGPTRGGGRLFYEGFSPDIREQLLKRITAEWTHDSTAIEGNTLTLGETIKVLELGLTVSGKPLKDHQEVYGHAHAIDLIYAMIARAEISEDDLCDLHRSIMHQAPVDAMNPIGAWKRDYNGTTGARDGKSIYMEYAEPAAIPRLMKRWLGDFNGTEKCTGRPEQAIAAYVRAHMIFVRIHPFFDGNGRMARLLANIPVLRGGFPPVVVPAERRSDYIGLLWEYQNDAGTIRPGSRLMPPHPAIRQMEKLLKNEWTKTVSLVEEALRRQAARSHK